MGRLSSFIHPLHQHGLHLLLIRASDSHTSVEYHLMRDIHPEFGFCHPARGILDRTYMIESDSPARTRNILPLLLLGLGLALVAASVLLILWNASPPADLSVVPAKANYRAPELTLTDIQGISHSLADYRGQVTLVNIWATWCEPCKLEMPALQAFYDRHKANGFVIIAINDGDPAADVLQFVKDYRLTFPIWLDPTYIATERAFKTLNLPSSYVIDRDGVVRLMWVGGISRRMLDKHVAPIIVK